MGIIYILHIFDNNVKNFNFINFCSSFCFLSKLDVLDQYLDTAVTCDKNKKLYMHSLQYSVKLTYKYSQLCLKILKVCATPLCTFKTTGLNNENLKKSLIKHTRFMTIYRKNSWHITDNNFFFLPVKHNELLWVSKSVF